MWRLVFAMRPESAQPLIVDVAAKQHGVITRSQLRHAGLSDGAIARRVRDRHLHRIHRAVYAVGRPDLTQEGRWMAAVLACEPGAVLSHRSAAALWGLRPSSSTVVDVTILGDAGRRQRTGIRLHRSSTLTEVTRHRGVPVTTPGRTLLDLADVVPLDHLRKAVERAEVLRLDVPPPDAPGRSGALARVLAAFTEPPATRSELERIVLALCDRHGLPRPLVNTQVAGLEVDFLWPDAALVLEADGFEHHGTRIAFERDRLRDQRLLRAGLRVARTTHRQATRAPGELAATLAAALAQAA